QMIAQAHPRHPDALLVVTGCYAELNPGAVAALPGVDLVVGNQGKDALINAITQHKNALPQPSTSNDTVPIDVSTTKGRSLPMLPLDTQHIGSDGALSFDLTEAEPVPDNPPSSFTLNTQLTEQANARLFSRTRVQMKVQDGCDNRCTYCIVPYVRGKSRSRSIASVVEHVQRKVRAGYQEIVLTGIHLGDYHPEDSATQDLGNLISTLLRETEMPRIRVSSLEPEDFHLEWLEHWEDPRMCRHFHLPMQSGSDAILRRMARRYTSDRYETIITAAQQRIPGVAISTDIITGFPGETDEDFEQTYQLAQRLKFAKTHVFRFSPRQGTPAARMRGQIKDEIKKARSQRLLTLHNEDSRLFRQQFLGQTVQVLIEQQKNGHWEGLTDNYLRVEVQDLPPQDWQHTLVAARLIDLVDDGITGIHETR
ncbi:MAG: MiaB/RimO family radical SAM methylthiotransferase, partial [Ktedonobacteraceae bacterium]|nr:MiaB/RimO family radical SAM methylthiotransferase [Ktedonobacteraceae bacterium]